MDYTEDWQESLKQGDKVLATIRHKTDGTQNIHDAKIDVVYSSPVSRKIAGYYRGDLILVNYNELTQIQ